MIRSSVIVLLLVVSAACLTADETPGSAFEQQLEILAKSPLVATLDINEPKSSDPESNPKSEIRNPKSLEELAESYGLKLFEQDGIQVIGPAAKADFTDIISGGAPTWLSDILDLVSSLTDSQIAALGSPQGLPARSLTLEQYEFLSAACSGDFQMIQSVFEEEPVTDELPEAGLPVEEARLVGWLEMKVQLNTPDHYDEDIAGSPPVTDWQMWPTRESLLTQWDTLGCRETPNELKKSDLDYSLPSLKVPITICGRTSLRDLVDKVSRETGMDLHASPGSDKVYLYISASGVPAGSLLKAVSLATTGTWRQFNDAYIFAVDLMGIGQIDAMAGRLPARMFDGWVLSEYRAATLLQNERCLTMLPFAPGTQFIPTLDQIRAMLRGGEEPELPWNALTPYQQALIEKELSESNPEVLSMPREAWSVNPTIAMYLAADFPGIGRVKLPMAQLDFDIIYGGVFPSPGLNVVPNIMTDLLEPDALNQNASTHYHLSINKPHRGYACKPSRFESPVSLIRTLTGNGFNALYLRVFSDGATAFSSTHFPKMVGLDADYLTQVITLAHAKGIRVFGVVDTLRWSDGGKGSWVSKHPELLDYDIFGRTRPDFVHAAMEGFAGWPQEAVAGEMAELDEFGEGFNCDAVSPFQPDVGKRLQGMLEELSAYELDGLVLDYTTMWHTRPDQPDGDLFAAGRPGHNSAARSEFFRLHGVDSIDISPWDAVRVRLPLQPIVQACTELGTAWAEFYWKSCDDLLESLAKKWKEVAANPQSEIRNPQSAVAPPSSLLPPHSDVWVLDTFPADRQERDWTRFKDLVDGVIVTGVNYPADGGRYYGFESMPILRASDNIATLRFAALLTSGLGYDISTFGPEVRIALEDLGSRRAWESNGVVLDFTTAGRKKTDYLRIIEPPKTGSNTSVKSP